MKMDGKKLKPFLASAAGGACAEPLPSDDTDGAPLPFRLTSSEGWGRADGSGGGQA
jgi:hypothetical protein